MKKKKWDNQAMYNIIKRLHKKNNKAFDWLCLIYILQNEFGFGLEMLGFIN